ncbi:Krueppel-like factor 5 [Episyrphus balteatus]|uniref:Krueppel-like factor 5 n=1 Tax=Episyrphus balteatus TaxID=286459 RepID=UPI0024853B9B|nr:Krueppel-like factor 5 [Episyrphus balteatus]
MDFLSNGFQQLFHDLELNSSSSNENYFQDVNNNITSNSDFHYTCDYYSYLDQEFEFHQDEPKDSMIGIDRALEQCLDYLIPLEENENQSEQSQWEWEINFLDSLVEMPEPEQKLPEKTPLCDDSCDLFLKDASENLNLYRKLLPSDTSDLTDKSYPCTFGECTKIYAKPAHLKAHMRRHMGEKPYVCTWPDCTWKFSRSDELARHRRSHSGVKPYKCNYCTKCFARSDHLAKHRKVHERRLLALGAGKERLGQLLPASVFQVRPGRKPKNQNLR